MSASTNSKGKTKNFKLLIWRQAGRDQVGHFQTVEAKNISDDMSFLEMLDFVNVDLTKQNNAPVEFDSDCREGICGSCSMVINGKPHGPSRGATACQVYMRLFQDGETIIIEPWRARAFPVIKDLVVDRGALDRIIQSGGYVSTKGGPHADANAILIPKNQADLAMDNAACIGCGACVAACPNASASLFTAAKITQLSLLPQGQVEAKERVRRMVEQMDKEGFGNCSNLGECEAACPKKISISAIANMKREFVKALMSGEAMSEGGGDGA